MLQGCSSLSVCCSTWGAGCQRYLGDRAVAARITVSGRQQRSGCLVQASPGFLAGTSSRSGHPPPPDRWKLCWEGEATAALGWFSCAEAKQRRKQLPVSFAGGHGFAGATLSSQLVEGLVISVPFGDRGWRPGKPHPRLPGVGGGLRVFCWCVLGLLTQVGFGFSCRGCCEAEAGTCCSSPPCSTAFSSMPDDGR